MTTGINDLVWQGLLQTASEHWDSPWIEYSILADWCEEQGEMDACECLRWMVWRRRRPFGSHNGDFVWYCDLEHQTSGKYEEEYKSSIPFVFSNNTEGYLPARFLYCVFSKSNYQESIEWIVGRWKEIKQIQPEISAQLLGGTL